LFPYRKRKDKRNASHIFPIGRKEKSYKGGGENGGKPTESTQRSFSRALLKAGKSIIIEKKRDFPLGREDGKEKK